jgi:hypothetical protein
MDTITLLVIVAVVLTLLVSCGVFSKKSSFKTTLASSDFDKNPPKEFTQLSQDDAGGIHLEPPVVPEEIGFAMKYPQGVGVSMSQADSNSFEPTNPGPLLTDYTIPESYGESSLADPNGNGGAAQGSRILKIKNIGNQMSYKPFDESLNGVYASAYTQGEVQQGNVQLINGTQPMNYDNGYVPKENFNLQTSPGQESSLPNCETTYPNVVKYNNFCITTGDIPYGQVVDNRVNPRLVSRWESFTGNYDRSQALAPIDGVLYPNLNIMPTA